MEFLTEPVYRFLDFYEWALTLRDKRVDGWLLMDNYYPTWVLTGLYLLFVYLGPKYMKSRPAYDLKWALIIYNFSLVALNFYIIASLTVYTFQASYSYICQPVNYSNDPIEINIAKSLWWYYFSKLVEFLDTVFFILRKKNNQVTFLHVYHHSTMFPIWWMGIKFVPGGQSFFGAWMNSGVHVIMYSYYGLAALGPRFQKYLWWKRYMTNIQLTQFGIGMCHCINSYTSGCDFPAWMHIALFIYGISMISLFVNFYIQTYIKSKQKKAAAAASTSDKNGDLKGKLNNNASAQGDHTTNGAVSNGDIGSMATEEGAGSHGDGGEVKRRTRRK